MELSVLLSDSFKTIRNLKAQRVRSFSPGTLTWQSCLSHTKLQSPARRNQSHWIHSSRKAFRAVPPRRKRSICVCPLFAKTHSDSTDHTIDIAKTVSYSIMLNSYTMMVRLYDMHVWDTAWPKEERVVLYAETKHQEQLDVLNSSAGLHMPPSCACMANCIKPS